jgi:hypothetical protein
MTDIIKAILKINPKAEVGINAEDINQITWHNGTTPIPANEILAKQQELIAEYNSNQYQRDRAKDYPSIQDQLDMQYWDKVNGTNKWQDTINAVKQKYPKGNN